MINRQEIFKKLIRNGFRLIQLHGIDSNGHCTCKDGATCPFIGKHPYHTGWQRMLITNENLIDEILKKYPFANFGIVTGNGLVVVDVDKKSGGFESLNKIKDIIEPTLTVKTGGGGYHFYYKTNEIVKNRTKVLPGIDVRGDGGYVVAPGSKHKSGNYYEIMEGKENE